MHSIKALQDKDRDQRLSQLQKKFKGHACIGLQMDMWTDTNSKMSYAGLNLTTVVEPSTETAAEPAQKQPLQLRVQSEVADLDVFPDSVHSGENIRDWLVALLWGAAAVAC